MAGGSGAGVVRVFRIFSKQITSPANAGNLVIATGTNTLCSIKSITLRANKSTTIDLASAAIYGGAGNVITFIGPVVGSRANIAAQDQQVAWTGVASLPVNGTITITLAGTGATPVDFQVDIEYNAVQESGRLT